MSGTIAFWGASAAAAGGESTIVADSASASHISGTIATASIRYKPDGTIETVSGGIADPAGDWVDPTSAASEWEIQATVVSGSTPSGTIGSWVALTSTRSWQLTLSVTGTDFSNLTFEFRRAAVGGAAEFTVTTNIISVEVI